MTAEQFAALRKDDKVRLIKAKYKNARRTKTNPDDYQHPVGEVLTVIFNTPEDGVWAVSAKKCGCDIPVTAADIDLVKEQADG